MMNLWIICYDRVMFMLQKKLTPHTSQLILFILASDNLPFSQRVIWNFQIILSKYFLYLHNPIMLEQRKLE